MHERRKTMVQPMNPYPTDIHEALQQFLAEWNNDCSTVGVQTSGSTGTPKRMQVEKRRMEASARLTCAFLGLKPEDTALLCMPLQYIAGKMVVVRSLVWGLKLIVTQPSGHPLAELTEAPTFAAMIPMQVYNSLQNPHERELLSQVKHLIIGGGAIDPELGNALRNFPNAVWSTYGMTETLSHIALRRLNGPDASDWYTPFDTVGIGLSSRGTLVINAPQVNPETLETNDIAEINPCGQFRILGRADNTINTGGVKVQIEQVEACLATILKETFAISAVPDPRLGEAVTLLYTGPQSADEIMLLCQQTLPPYWRPKHCYHINNIPQTGSGKISRAEVRQLAARLHEATKG